MLVYGPRRSFPHLPWCRLANRHHRLALCVIRPSSVTTGDASLTKHAALSRIPYLVGSAFPVAPLAPPLLQCRRPHEDGQLTSGSVRKGFASLSRREELANMALGGKGLSKEMRGTPGLKAPTRESSFGQPRAKLPAASPFHPFQRAILAPGASVHPNCPEHLPIGWHSGHSVGQASGGRAAIDR